MQEINSFIDRQTRTNSVQSSVLICKTWIFYKNFDKSYQVRIHELFGVLEILIMVDKYAEKDFNVIGDVFVCTKLLHLVKKFQDANVCHDKDLRLEQFAESWEK